MKQQIKILLILGIIGTINFLVIGMIFINPYSPLAILPLWMSISLILISYFVETIAIIKGQHIEPQKFKTYFKYYIFGLLVTGAFLFMRDFIPSTIYRNQMAKQEQAVLQGREIFSEASVGKPNFSAEKYLENTNFDEYYFYVDIPITVSKPFTEIQLLNAVELRFVNQEYGKFPTLQNCQNDSHPMLFPLDLAKIVNKDNVIFNSLVKQKAGTYTIRFRYSYYGKGCTKENINSVLNQKLNLNIVNGQTLKTITIDNIELR